MATAETLFSLFFLIGLGYLAKRTLLSDQPLTALNSFVYYFAVPALLFRSATQIDAEQLLQPLYIGSFIVATCLTAGLCIIGCRLLLPAADKPTMAIRALNGTFPNVAYMGIPLVFGVMGRESYAATICIILTANLFLISGTQLLIETLQSSPAATGRRTKHTLLLRCGQLLDRSLLRSPIFLSTVAGVSISALQIPLPSVLSTPLDMLAPAAIPVALFCLGAGLKFTAMQQYRIELSWLLAVKLVIQPLITLGVLWLSGITDPNWLVPAVLLSALPTGALAHVIACRYGVAEQQTSLAILLSTLVSALSLWVWVEVLV